MSVQGISDASLLSQLAQTSDTTSSAVNLLAGTGASPSDQVSVSDPAKLFAQLQSLAQSNPAEFKQVTAEIASKLQSDAQSVGGAQGAKLDQIADRFNQASQSGNLSALAPPGAQGTQGAGHAHHHHGGGGGHHKSSSSQSGSSSQNSIFSDVTQTIQDALNDLDSSAATTATTT